MFIISDNFNELRKYISLWKQKKYRVGFIPTMGNLHSGHLRLIEQIKKRDVDKTIVSIFVNPRQFGPNEDYTNYPRTLEDDIKKLRDLDVDLLFCPDKDLMYPIQNTGELKIDNKILMNDLCGSNRVGHFNGVLLVVNKLFNLLQPNIVIFGQKDYQQYLIIKNMVENLFMPIELILSPIIREIDGLAMSSRNKYLNKNEREKAPKLNKSLITIKDKILQHPDKFHSILENQISELEKDGFFIDYFELRHKNNLSIVENFNYENKKYILLIAAKIGNTRLIDNIIL
tara:strand:- start:2228 stop:3085 length:858 start_codon:yes stop_codon:yes gene_type:complete